MTVPEEAVRRGGRGRRGGGGASKAAASLVVIWGVLIFSQLSMLCALESNTGSRYITTTARKTRVFKTEDSSFHPPDIASSSMAVGREAYQDPASSPSPSVVVYEDDKRLIHTGPNPLHN